MIDPPQDRPEEPTAVTPHGGIRGGESQQWLSYPTEPHVRFGGRGVATPLPDPYQGALTIFCDEGAFSGRNLIVKNLCYAQRRQLFRAGLWVKIRAKPGDDEPLRHGHARHGHPRRLANSLPEYASARGFSRAG